MDSVLQFQWLNEALETETGEFVHRIVEGVLNHQDSIDLAIESFSEKHTTQISSIVRCILRMGIFEIMDATTPPSIVIDDLCNLAGRYDLEESVRFVNGILDQFRLERLKGGGGGKEPVTI